MSGHLIGCAGGLDDPGLGTSHKLALPAFADSADDRTHIAFPGYEGVQRWANCSRGRAAELIRDLVGLGYLRQHKRGHRGQRAEYIVFPGGCCELHRPDDEPTVDVAALAEKAGVTVEQARILLGHAPDVQIAGSAADPQDKGSDAPDAMSVNGSDVPDAFEPTYSTGAPGPVENLPNASGTSDAMTGKGPERVHGSGVNADAFTPTTTTSPQPPASGGPSCAKHDTPARNCRGCGTTNRQLAEKAARERKQAERDARIAAQLAERERAARAATQHDPDKTRRAAEKARQGIADARAARQRAKGAA